MAKQLTIEKELTDLKAFLAGYLDGISVSKLGAHYKKLLNERTLQRRLATLLQQSIIRTTGRGSSLIYYPVKPDENPTEPVQPTQTAVPLSAEGQFTQRIVQQPVGNRIPVVYQLGFLANYVPNVTYYLTAGERARLLQLGQTAQLDQPAGTYARQILQRLLIDLSWNSSRLEGNTYSLLDTQRLISQGQEADNKSAADAQMILNHKEAIEFLVESADEIGLNRYTITNLQTHLSKLCS